MFVVCDSCVFVCLLSGMCVGLCVCCLRCVCVWLFVVWDVCRSVCLLSGMCVGLCVCCLGCVCVCVLFLGGMPVRIHADEPC